MNVSGDLIETPAAAGQNVDKLNGPIAPAWRGQSLTKTTKRWRSQQTYDDLSRRQQAALAALREWERLVKAKALPELARCLGGPSLLARYHAGKAWARSIPRSYELTVRAEAQRGDPKHAATLAKYARQRALMKPRDWLAVGWLATAQLDLGAEAVIARGEDWGELLGCCSETARRTMNKLEDLGFLTIKPLHMRSPDGTHHVRTASAYRLSAHVMSLLGIRGVNPEKFEPTERASCIAVPSASGDREREGSAPPAVGHRGPEGSTTSHEALDASEPAIASSTPATITAPASSKPCPADAPVRPGKAAKRVKTRPDAPLGSGGGRSRTEARSLVRYENAADVAKFKATVEREANYQAQQHTQHVSAILFERERKREAEREREHRENLAAAREAAARVMAQAAAAPAPIMIAAPANAAERDELARLTHQALGVGVSFYREIQSETKVTGETLIEALRRRLGRPGGAS